MLFDTETLLIFIAAGLALNFTPGADMLFCFGQGVSGGPRRGVFAALGIATGSAIHTLLAAFGVAAILQSTPAAFEALRWAGITYLLWLAFQALRTRTALTPATGQKTGSDLASWREGTLVNLFNPKVFIFIMAFLPQFVGPSKGSAIAQFLILGLIFNITGTIVNGAVGVFAGGLGRTLAANAPFARWLSFLSASIFAGLAAQLAFDRK